MPLQNRVDPLGALHAVSSRGLFTGNRGIIHDPIRRVINRRWTTRAWIICACSFKDRPARDVMGYNGRSGGVGWTELFFLDEVTALAAGHRPCFTCRREAAVAYRAAVARGLGLSAPPSAPEMDVRLHAERRRSGGLPLAVDSVDGLPDGTMVEAGTAVFAVRNKSLIRWSFDGWSADHPGAGAPLRLVTPPTSIAALAAGFRPVWHPSALTLAAGRSI